MYPYLEGYKYLTRHTVPGPNSASYFIPLIVLPLALAVPRQFCSRWQNISMFMPVIFASTVHSWICMGGVDVISVNVLLWSLFLLALRDPWRDFIRLDLSMAHVEEKRFRRRDKLQGTALGGSRTSSPYNITTANGRADEPQTHSPSSSSATPTSMKKDETPKRPRPQRRVTFRNAEQTYPEDLNERLAWIGILLVSIRLSNWKINSPSHDRAQPAPPAFSSRKHFAARAIVNFVRGYIVLDLTRAYIAHDAFYTDPSVRVTAAPSFLPHALQTSLPPLFIRSTVTALQAWALISQFFYLPCLLPVLLNALHLIPDEWSPHTWPPYFGPFSTVFTHALRGFWGRYWHQTMRWAVAGPGYAVADALGLANTDDGRGRGGLMRYALITTSAFLLSGVVHMGLVPPEPLRATMPVNSVRLLVAGFFWSQIPAMLAETVVARVVVSITGIEMWQSGTSLALRKVVNFIWLLAWFSVSLASLTAAGRQLGYWEPWPVPVSFWKGLRGEGWIAWPFFFG